MKHLWRLLVMIPILLLAVGCNNDDDDSMNPDENQELPNLVEAAQGAGLTTLLDAVGAVDGLDQALLDAEEITVFAPTNDAFTDALDAYNVTNLNELVEAIGGVQNLEIVLEYHVVASAALSSDLQDGQNLNTLAGQQLTVNVNGSSVSLTDATGNTVNVVTPDVEIENGVVHVIDGVLLPELDIPTAPNLVEAATEAGLTTLLDAVGEVDGLDQTLLNAEEITVFAPTNDAFAALLSAFGVDNLNDLVTELGGIDKLDSVLKFHVVPSAAFSSDLSDGQTITTLQGEDLTVSIDGSTVSISDVSGNIYTVTTADVEIANGVVHVIDGVLIPNLEYPNVVEAAQAASLTTLIDAVVAAQLDQALLDTEEMTVFGPTNEAFGQLLTQYGAADLDALIARLGVSTVVDVLNYHVIPSAAFSHDLSDGQVLTSTQGANLTVNISAEGAVTLTDADGSVYNVTATDIVIDNGVVHVIDGVLLPLDRPTLVEAATNAGLSTLLDAVGNVDGLADQLLASEAITVFAPTNAAFANALQAYGVSDLSELVTELGGVEKLETVLGFHVIPSVAYASDLSDGQMLSTLSGQMLTVNVNGADVSVTDAAGSTYNVTTADVTIENGVVHVIDGVLLPNLEYPTVVEAAQSAGLTTLIDAVVAAGLDDDLLANPEMTVFGPTNEAFATLLAQYGVSDLDGLIARLGASTVVDVLNYHVIPSAAFSHDLSDGQVLTTAQGADLTVNISSEGAVSLTDADGVTYNVTATDVVIENGVVHVIDGVLLPLDRPTLVEAATNAGLTTLLDAVGAVDGLADDLLASEAITVFAPDNNAFAALLSATNSADLDELITNIGGAEVLANVLNYHVVASVAYAEDLSDGDQLTTLAGDVLTVNVSGTGDVSLTDIDGNTYNVSTTDVTIQNGVVHVIDGVFTNLN